MLTASQSPASFYVVGSALVSSLLHPPRPPVTQTHWLQLTRLGLAALPGGPAQRGSGCRET